MEAVWGSNVFRWTFKLSSFSDNAKKTGFDKSIRRRIVKTGCYLSIWAVWGKTYVRKSKVSNFERIWAKNSGVSVRMFPRARQNCFLCVHEKKSEEFFGKKFLRSLSKSERQFLGLWPWKFWQALQSCILRVWRYILERINTSGNLYSFHRFRTLSEKNLSFVIMFFLFWQGCENGLHRVHENKLNKGVFLRKLFFPYTFWSVSDNFSRSPRISWPGCRNCILPFYGKILRKMTFFAKKFCQSFSNLERENLGFYRLFPIEFSKLRSTCPWETFEETEFFWTSSFSQFRTLKKKTPAPGKETSACL